MTSVMPKRVTIVYFACILPGSQWSQIISGQLNQLKEIGLLEIANLYTVITAVKDEEWTQVQELVLSIIPNCHIERSNKNTYEYPGIHAIWRLAKEDPNKIYLYFHSKGMSYAKNGREHIEKCLFRDVIVPWRSWIQLMDTNNSVDKIGFGASEEGWQWFNFWWVRGSYLAKCQEPIISRDRYYYEYWLGRQGDKSKNTCFSIADQKIGVTYSIPSMVGKMRDAMNRRN